MPQAGWPVTDRPGGWKSEVKVTARPGSGERLLQAADFSLCPHVEIAEETGSSRSSHPIRRGSTLMTSSDLDHFPKALPFYTISLGGG